MNRRSTELLIVGAFTITSIAVSWKQLTSVSAAIASSLGAEPTSALHQIIVDGGAPFVLVLLAGVAVWLYNRLLWPTVSGEYIGGTWVYSLVAKTDGADLDIVGYFRITYSHRVARIEDGVAFYSSIDALTYRGNWTASTVWANGEELRAVFSMHAVNPTREPLPSRYDGYIEIRRSRDHPIRGRAVWIGYFQDLGDRRAVIGPVYAERLRSTPRLQRLSAQDLLTPLHRDLVGRAASRT